jgi:hypothetical protein
MSENDPTRRSFHVDIATIHWGPMTIGDGISRGRQESTAQFDDRIIDSTVDGSAVALALREYRERTCV